MKNSRPDPVYFAPLKKLGGGWIAFKDSPSPPPAPDYAGAAKAQGAANLDAAVATAKLSNPNINSPYGSQSVSYGTPAFNQAGYDAAMAKYQNGQPTGPAPTQDQFTTMVGDGGNGGGSWSPQVDQNAYNQALAAYNSGSGPAPTRDQFTTTADPYTPNVTQTLNPESQKIFESQQKTRLGLSGLANTGTGIAQGVLDRPFQFNGPTVKTDVGDFGRAQGLGEMPTAQGSLNTSGIAQSPVNAGMTAQNAIMSRLRPQIDRENQQSDAQLANQGITRGSEAYNNAKTLLGQQHNDLLNQAASSGIGLDLTANNQGFNQALAGGQFANQAVGQNFGQGLSANQSQNAAVAQNFNQGLQGGQFANTAQGQALAQALQQRGLPLNEITALMSGSQIQNPQFQPYTGANVAPAPIMAGAQAQGQAGMNLYNAQQGAANATTSGLFSLGGAALGAMYGGPFGAAMGGQVGRTLGSVGNY